MKAASGETESGGDIRLQAIVEGRSLDTLCVLERACRDDAALFTPTGVGEELDIVDSESGVVIVRYCRQSYQDGLTSRQDGRPPVRVSYKSVRPE